MDSRDVRAVTKTHQRAPSRPSSRQPCPLSRPRRLYGEPVRRGAYNDGAGAESSALSCSNPTRGRTSHSSSSSRWKQLRGTGRGLGPGYEEIPSKKHACLRQGRGNSLENPRERPPFTKPPATVQRAGVRWRQGSRRGGRSDNAAARAELYHRTSGRATAAHHHITGDSPAKSRQQRPVPTESISAREPSDAPAIDRHLLPLGSVLERTKARGLG